jgi:hypothetical protein
VTSDRANEGASPTSRGSDWDNGSQSSERPHLADREPSSGADEMDRGTRLSDWSHGNLDMGGHGIPSSDIGPRGGIRSGLTFGETPPMTKSLAERQREMSDV